MCYMSLILAMKIQEEIITLLATALALLFIVSKTWREFSYSHMIKDLPLSASSQWKSKHIFEPLRTALTNCGASCWIPKLYEMADYIGEKEEEYTWASGVLELGKSWTDVAAKMLNV